MKTINLLLYVMRQLHEARQVVAYLMQKPESEVNLNADLTALYDCIVNLTTDNGMTSLKCEKLQNEVDRLTKERDAAIEAHRVYATSYHYVIREAGGFSLLEFDDKRDISRVALDTDALKISEDLVTAYDETGSISRVMNGVR